ncbi:MAG: SUMF1/EgtB/PvdO family nonheme iron enzyme [Bacteroidales bacterium]
MKKYLFKSLCLFLLVALVAMFGCGGGSSALQLPTGSSAKTGWKYNDPKHGGFEVRQMNEPTTGPGLVFVPGGTFTMGRVTDELPKEWNNQPRRVTVDSYYIDATEVRNIDYREYLHWLSVIYPSYPEVHRQALPDTLVWRKPLAYNEPLVNYYFRLVSFNDYPVVGVNWLQASEYCEWRSDRVNELALIRAGILELDVLEQKDSNCFTTDAYVLGLYTGKVKRNLPDVTGRKPEGRTVAYEDGILLPKYRLPTEAEWEYAALGITGDATTGIISDKGTYPWKGYRVRKSKEPNKGMLMANFQKARGDLKGVAGMEDGGAPTPLPVTSFWPNDFGLYCMAGNVSEWVLDVYRTLSFEDVEDARPFRGNIYTSLVRGEDGRPVKDSLGRVKRDTVGAVAGRTNYVSGDNRNYRDGDIFSVINSELDMSKTETTTSTKMYNVGRGESRQGMSSFVTETSRVYKGGSYQDRAYWLSPGTRRFLDEAIAREDIGFRCAMDRLGAALPKGGR